MTGVSRSPKNHGSNVIYKRFRDRGYEVYAVNPNASKVEGDACYGDLGSVPGGVNWVVIGTRPETAVKTVHDCVDLGIEHRLDAPGCRVWQRLTRGRRIGREHGLTVIDGGCPCMFEPAADRGHKVICVVSTLTGALPRHVSQDG